MAADSGTGELASRIAQRTVPPGKVAAWWLGGSGFVFKTPAGAQVYVDPYLSDVVNAIFGMARAFPAPLRPEEVRPDVIISTHWHEDHLDPGAHAPWEGSLQSAIDRTATGRGGAAQCRKAGRGRSKKISEELGQSLRRCEIGVGELHVLVDARAIEFRHTVFSRPMHGQTGWNRMVLFITRDSSDINAADEFA